MVAQHYSDLNATVKLCTIWVGQKVAPFCIDVKTFLRFLFLPRFYVF